MTEYTNTLLLSDEELKVLNDLVRQSKVTASAEELLMVRMGRSASPLLDVVFKVGVLWETRMNEINNPQSQEPEGVPLPDAEPVKVTDMLPPPPAPPKPRKVKNI